MKYHSNEQDPTSRTDNKALTWLQTTKNERAKLLRWALELQSYLSTIEHCPGKENQLPDMLSRDPNARESHEEDVEDVERLLPRACPAALHALAECERAQAEDGEVTAKVVEALRDPAKSAESWVQRFRWGYFEEDYQLFYGSERKLFVPTDVRQRFCFRTTRRPPRSRRDGEVNRPALPLAEAARKCSEVRASLPPLRTVQVWVLPTSRAPEAAATAEETICRVCHTHEHDV
jgi:hypothetical protein